MTGVRRNSISISPLEEKLAYNPLDSNLLSSSILAEGPDVVATWALLLASADRHGVSNLTIPFVASVLRISDERAEKAFQVLCSPDPKSRNHEHEGRRLIPDPEDGWIVVSHIKYRERATRTSAAERQRRYEERRKQRKQPEPESEC